MPIFKKANQQKQTSTPSKSTEKESNKAVFAQELAKKNYSDIELIDIESEYDFSTLDTTVALFVKYYLLNGGNGTAAYLKLRNSKISYGTARVGANRYLRKLRSTPEFWDLLGLGYGNLKEVVDLLKTTKPEKAADIIMKVNKEDTLDVNVKGKMTIAFEKGLDD